MLYVVPLEQNFSLPSFPPPQTQRCKKPPNNQIKQIKDTSLLELF